MTVGDDPVVAEALELLRDASELTNRAHLILRSRFGDVGYKVILAEAQDHTTFMYPNILTREERRQVVSLSWTPVTNWRAKCTYIHRSAK